MAYVKHLVTKYCQNNLLFKALSHIMTHKMRASVYFAAGNKSGFLSCPLLFNVWFSPFSSQKGYCFSMTFYDPQFHFTTFQAWKMKLYNASINSSGAHPPWATAVHLLNLQFLSPPGRAGH